MSRMPLRAALVAVLSAGIVGAGQLPGSVRVRAPEVAEGTGALTVAAPRVRPVVFALRAPSRPPEPDEAAQQDEVPEEDQAAELNEPGGGTAGATSPRVSGKSSSQGFGSVTILVLTPLPASVPIDEPLTFDHEAVRGGWTPAPVVALDRVRRLAIVRVTVPPVPPDSAYLRLPPGVSVEPEAPGTIYVLEGTSRRRGWLDCPQRSSVAAGSAWLVRRGSCDAWPAQAPTGRARLRSRRDVRGRHARGRRSARDRDGAPRTRRSPQDEGRCGRRTRATAAIGFGRAGEPVVPSLPEPSATAKSSRTERSAPTLVWVQWFWPPSWLDWLPAPTSHRERSMQRSRPRPPRTPPPTRLVSLETS